MANNIHMLAEIDRRAGSEYMLRQLAEECAELGQAALKLIRAQRGETPMTVAEATSRLVEELADVSIMWDWAYYVQLDEAAAVECDFIAEAKADRMYDRIIGGASDAWRTEG